MGFGNGKRKWLCLMMMMFIIGGDCLINNDYKNHKGIAVDK